MSGKAGPWSERIEMQALDDQTDSYQRPRAPSGLTIYAIGDIHGRSDLLQRSFALIDEDLEITRPDSAFEVYLGDYVDRGPASRDVIDLLIGRSRLRDTIFLRGNHEAMLLAILDGLDDFPSLRSFGLLSTIRSYGLSPSFNPPRSEELALVAELRHIFPPEHYEFLRNLQTSFACGDYFFVHAGVRPQIPLDAQHEADMLWIRDDFLGFDGQFEKYIVHGHSPVPKIDIRRNRMNIDTGAYATNNLTIVRLRETSVSAAVASPRSTD